METLVSRKVDRISGLSDLLLLRILSFLPANEAVATSLLSKRWKTLWLSLPTVYLNRQASFESATLFYEFGDKLLKLVDLKSVKKFVLVCYNFRDDEHFKHHKIRKWIHALVNSSVEHLELHMRRLDQYKLPSSVLVANNIRVLKLCEVKVGTVSHVNLPSLEVLYLEHIDFPNIKSLEMLLSGCALLKNLVIKYLYGHFFNCSLVIRGLNHLVTAEVPQFLIPLKVLSNVTFLRLLQTPFFDMQDMRPFSDDMPEFRNLSHLECVVGEWTKMVKCLWNFPKLQKLVVLEPYCYKGDSTCHLKPVLNVPPCVSLHLKEFTILFSQNLESKFKMLKFITENARVLRTAIVMMRDGHANKEKLKMLQKLAAKRKGSRSCCMIMKEQPLVFMIS